jgi:hypothetical protein
MCATSPRVAFTRTLYIFSRSNRCFEMKRTKFSLNSARCCEFKAYIRGTAATSRPWRRLLPPKVGHESVHYKVPRRGPHRSSVPLWDIADLSAACTRTKDWVACYPFHSIIRLASFCNGALFPRPLEMEPSPIQHSHQFPCVNADE